jgi:Ni/Fe-hydrogenase subunit HybB-like protein
MEQWPTRTYIPSWQELTITAGLVAFGFTAFGFVARYFNVFGHDVETLAGERQARASEEIVQQAVVATK